MRGEGLASVFMKGFRDITRVLVLTWKVKILAAFFKERVADHVPLIGKEGKHTLLFHILIRGIIHGNLRCLAQIVVDPENVRVRSVSGGNLLTLKHIPWRVGLRKEMLQIHMIRDVCPREVGGQSLVGHITRLFFMLRGMCQHTVGLVLKNIRLFKIFFC